MITNFSARLNKDSLARMNDEWDSEDEGVGIEDDDEEADDELDALDEEDEDDMGNGDDEE